MQTPAEYLKRSESAVRKLFDGIGQYQAILRRAPVPVLVTSYSDDMDLDSQLASWQTENAQAIQASVQAERDFIAESFALATLCGSVLQVAAKAIECFSTNVTVPPEWNPTIGVSSKAVRFCMGKPVRKVPLGLVIFAGRNQHMHFEDQALREPNVSVFEQLTINHGKNTDPAVRDPAFDLRNTHLVSFASNVTAVIGWRTYDAYESDMRGLLAI